MNATDTCRDIDERALAYAVRVVKLFVHLRDDAGIVGQVIGKQFLRSATSVGANLAEAKSAESKADFIHKCSIAQKEARECLYWIRLLAQAEVVPPTRLDGLASETNELVAILTAITRTAKENNKTHRNF